MGFFLTDIHVVSDKQFLDLKILDISNYLFRIYLTVTFLVNQLEALIEIKALIILAELNSKSFSFIFLIKVESPTCDEDLSGLRVEKKVFPHKLNFFHVKWCFLCKETRMKRIDWKERVAKLTVL